MLPRLAEAVLEGGVKSEGEAARLCLPVQTEVVCNEVVKALGLIPAPYINDGKFPQQCFSFFFFKKQSWQKKPRLSWLWRFVLTVNRTSPQLEVSVLNDVVTILENSFPTEDKSFLSL